MNLTEYCNQACETANATALATCKQMCYDLSLCDSGDQYFWGALMGCFLGFVVALLAWLGGRVVVSRPAPVETKFKPTYKLEGVPTTADCSEC